MEDAAELGVPDKGKDAVFAASAESKLRRLEHRGLGHPTLARVYACG